MGHPPVATEDGKGAAAGGSDAESIRKQFATMKPGAERSAFFAENRKVLSLFS